MDIVEVGLKLTYVLLVVGVAAAVIMPLFQAVTTDPKSLVKVAIGVGIIAVVYLVGYMISGNEVTSTYTEFNVNASISKAVGGLLIAMYILMILAVLGILFTEISKIAK